MTLITGPKNRRLRRAPRGEVTQARRSARGFTLLELILVLLLISTVLAMAAPSLRGFARGRQTAEAASQLLAMTHWARSQAAAEGRLYRLNVDVQAGAYWLSRQRGGAFVELDGEYGRHFRLPDGVTVSLETPTGGSASNPAGHPAGHSANGSADDSAAYIQFHPNGRCDEAAIELRGRQGEVFRVTCDSATERFRIASPEETQGS